MLRIMRGVPYRLVRVVRCLDHSAPLLLVGPRHFYSWLVQGGSTPGKMDGQAHDNALK
jgi:hypothetical protein